jgi:hypothetical protein
MKHAYLTEQKIVEALHARAITEREAKELQQIVKRCQNGRETQYRYAMAS